jgi:hypothetical protein
LKNIALAPKDSKVRVIWLVTGMELVGSLLEKLVNIGTVCGMTCRNDRLRPKPTRSLVLIKHGFCHLDECPILPFGYPILLRIIGSQKLMLDAFFVKKVFYLSVLELSAIVTSNFIDFSIKFILCSL